MEAPSASATRAEWNEYAESIGLDPSDYSTKEELINAVSNTEDLPPEAETSAEQGVMPSEAVGPDEYASDPTPGAVTDETEIIPSDDELPLNIREGSWVVLKDTISQELLDEGARPGMVAVVMTAPYSYVEADDFSPIRHAVPNLEQPLVVRTRDEKALMLSVDWDDVAIATTQAPSGVVPVG